MPNFYGITHLKVKILEVTHDKTEELNVFLEEHNGNIVDIQTAPMMYGFCKFIIVYKG